MNLSTAGASVLREPVGDQPASAPSVSLKDIASFPTTAPTRPISQTSSSDTLLSSRSQAPGYSPLDGGTVAIASDPLGPVNGYVRQVDMIPAVGEPVPQLGTIRQRWSEFVRSCEEMRLLSAALQASTPSELYGRTIRLYVTTEPDLRIIERNRETLSQKLLGFYNAPLLIEGVLGAAPSAVASHSDIQTPLPPNSDHPFIRGLIEILGAGPL
jgi:hypothetical protein